MSKASHVGARLSGRANLPVNQGNGRVCRRGTGKASHTNNLKVGADTFTAFSMASDIKD